MKSNKLLALLTCFSLILVLAELSFLAGYKPALAQEVIKWKFSFWGSPRAWTQVAEDWAKWMKEESKGRFEVKFYYGETLGPAKEQIDGLKAGMFEAAGVCPFYSPGKVPLNQVLDLPFLLPDSGVVDLSRLLMQTWRHQALLDELKAWKTVPLLPIVISQYHLMGNKRIAKVEDFKGVRIAGMSADMGKAFAKFGAVPTPMPAPEIYNSLERGTIDLVCFPFTYAYAAYKLHEISKYVTVGIAAGSPQTPFLANKAAFDALPQDIKALHKKYYDDIFLKVCAKPFEEADAKNIPIFKQKLEWIEFPVAERAKLEKGAGGIWDSWVEEWKGRGPTREILNHVIAERKKITGK